MLLTKLGHACVTLEHDGRRLVIDPGAFTDPAEVRGAEAVLITHEHWDHFDEERLRAALDADPALQVWTLRAVADQLDGLGDRLHVVGEGDTFTAAGMDVAVLGQLHEQIHPDIPRVTNVGFLVAGRVFHPGDALTVPPGPVETLLLPVHAPWSRMSEVIDYVRAVRPQQAFRMHDVLLSEVGLSLVDRLLGDGGPGTGAAYRGLHVGEQLELG
jgi:L-ascorbate metabolism protein UlaG (beta-lactamase superfamily)